jgi:hypothetical protein
VIHEGGAGSPRSYWISAVAIWVIYDLVEAGPSVAYGVRGGNLEGCSVAAVAKPVTYGQVGVVCLRVGSGYTSTLDLSRGLVKAMGRFRDTVQMQHSYVLMARDAGRSADACPSVVSTAC